MKISFEGRIVVVAGGTGGLGKSVSLAFLNEGATVAVTYRHEEELAALKKAAGSNSSALSGHLVDVTDEKQTATFGEKLVTQHGKVDALVNTVGG
jgi:NAD(P)-dependent dehydrogenase (short-subunit alcohol dehydrogenase family)